MGDTGSPQEQLKTALDDMHLEAVNQLVAFLEAKGAQQILTAQKIEEVLGMHGGITLGDETYFVGEAVSGPTVATVLSLVQEGSLTLEYVLAVLKDQRELKLNFS